MCFLHHPGEFNAKCGDYHNVLSLECIFNFEFFHSIGKLYIRYTFVTNIMLQNLIMIHHFFLGTTAPNFTIEGINKGINICVSNFVFGYSILSEIYTYKKLQNYYSHFSSLKKVYALHIQGDTEKEREGWT